MHYFTYTRNVMLLSIVISLITAAMVFLALYLIIVRPIKRISRNMTAFSQQPENTDLVFRPSGRADEIGVAEERLAAFQTDLQNTLRQKQHLGGFGTWPFPKSITICAIFWLRLNCFQIALASLKDPTVQRFAPKLIRTIDRAVEYTKSVISYGKSMEKPPERRQHHLYPIVVDVAELLGLDKNRDVEWVNNVPKTLEVNADSEQLFRVIMNLFRNALQAMLPNNEGSIVARLKVEALRAGDLVTIRNFRHRPGYSRANS